MASGGQDRKARGAARESAAAAPPSTAAECARGYFEALARRDPEAMVAYWAPDGVDDIVPLRVLRGRDEIRSFFEGLFAAFPDLTTQVRRIVSDDRCAAVEWRMRGTFTGRPFQGIAPTGQRLELRGVDLVEVKGGLIVRNVAYYDGAAFARQVGLLPPADSTAERALKSVFNAYVRVRKDIFGRLGG